MTYYQQNCIGWNEEQAAVHFQYYWEKSVWFAVQILQGKGTENQGSR